MPDYISTLNLFQNRQNSLGGAFQRRIHVFDNITSVENLLLAWQEFQRGKRKRRDVQEFSLNLMDNILSLYQDLKNKTYRHGPYTAFNISDPKPRNIHKATVRDRLLHHAVYRVLYPYFEKRFISDSYSCRLGKGTHKALNQFRKYAYKVSKNNTKQCWVLKCDIKKFFASIDHEVLRCIIRKYVDADTYWLLSGIIDSFHTTPIYAMADMRKVGLPLGNLTSQLLVNIYMNEFDQYVKHKLRVKHYIRYADDFIVTTIYRSELEALIPKIGKFLKGELRLELHKGKIYIRTLSSGVDFLGWVNFSGHRVLRTTTKRRMLKNLNKINLKSYLGLLRHGNTYKLRSGILSNHGHDYRCS